MRTRRLPFVISTVVIVLSAIGIATWYSQLEYGKSGIDLERGSNEQIWNAILCRARVYLEKARGGVSELSWTDLWGLMRVGAGFHCSEGSSMAASLNFSAIASEDDRRTGASIFRERCARCHCSEGSGGSVGPSLTRSNYDHGDSDLALYQVLRDGIPGTAMPRAGIPQPQLLQVIAYLKALQAHLSADQNPEAPRLAVQVTSERLKSAGTNT